MKTDNIISNEQPDLFVDAATFHADVDYIEALWQHTAIGDLDMPLIDIGEGEPLVFVPILEHLEFVYARQIRALNATRRVIIYRRQENRTRAVGLTERAEELKRVLDSLRLQRVDLVGHGDAAMVLLEFAARYPERCRSLIIVAQAADYQIAPHPFIWLLHEVFLRLPVQHFLPDWFLRRIVINYIVSNRPVDKKGAITEFDEKRQHAADHVPTRMLPRHLIEEQFRKIALWPFVYKFSVLPIIHNFDMRDRLTSLTMPVLLINRANDALSPEAKTRWLAENLPDCAGYHVISGGERFFMYSEPDVVNSLFIEFLDSLKEPE